MTKAAPPRRRGRPRNPPPPSPFDAQRLSDEALRRKLIDALVEARAPRDAALTPAQALAGTMFPAAPDRHERTHEAVARWFKGGNDLLRAQEIIEPVRGVRNSGNRMVNAYAKTHRKVAAALQALAGDPQSDEALRDAADALALLPPDPPPVGDQPPPEPDPPLTVDAPPGHQRLTAEALRPLVGDPAARERAAALAREMAEDCERVAREAKGWPHAVRQRQRIPLAYEAARWVAAFFDAAGMGQHVVKGRKGSAATAQGQRRGPVGSYCETVDRVLHVLMGDHAGDTWRSATEAVVDEREAATAAEGGPTAPQPPANRISHP